MAYRFKLDESFEKGFRRIAREQIDRALAELSPLDVGTRGVHESRKALKRLRALVRVIAPAVGDKTASRRDNALRKIAHLLAARRDEAVLAHTIERLEVSGSVDDKAAFGQFRQQLVAHAADSPRPLEGETAQRARLLLVKEAKHVAKITFKSRGFDALRPGLHNSYRAGRRALKLAYKKPSDDGFHELRKAVQWHWRQMSLLSRAWPAAFDARIAASRELSQMLGDDHDLAMLAQAAKSTTALPDYVITAVERACLAEQQKLRLSAEYRLERLFAESPGAFCRRMEAYWCAGQHITPIAGAKTTPVPVEQRVGPAPADLETNQTPPIAAKMSATTPSQRRA